MSKFGISSKRSFKFFEKCKDLQEFARLSLLDVKSKVIICILTHPPVYRFSKVSVPGTSSSYLLPFTTIISLIWKIKKRGFWEVSPDTAGYSLIGIRLSGRDYNCQDHTFNNCYVFYPYFSPFSPNPKFAKNTENPKNPKSHIFIRKPI